MWLASSPPDVSVTSAPSGCRRISSCSTSTRDSSKCAGRYMAGQLFGVVKGEARVGHDAQPPLACTDGQVAEHVALVPVALLDRVDADDAQLGRGQDFHEPRLEGWEREPETQEAMNVDAPDVDRLVGGQDRGAKRPDRAGRLGEERGGLDRLHEDRHALPGEVVDVHLRREGPSHGRPPCRARRPQRLAPRARAAILSAKLTWLSSSGTYPILSRAPARLQKRWVLPLMP